MKEIYLEIKENNINKKSKIKITESDILIETEEEKIDTSKIKENDIFEEGIDFPFLKEEKREKVLKLFEISKILENENLKKIEMNKIGKWLEIKKEKFSILLTNNISLKTFNIYKGKNEIMKFKYKTGEILEKLPENYPFLTVNGEEMIIENEKYKLIDDNNFGVIRLYNKNNKLLFEFNVELCDNQDKELLYIIEKENFKNKKNYFEIILEMYKILSNYVKEEVGKTKLESYLRIIPKKIKEIENQEK